MIRMLILQATANEPVLIQGFVEHIRNTRNMAFLVLRDRSGSIQAMGTVVADLTQACVVSLAPVTAHIEEEFEGWFGDKSSAVSFARARHEREAKKGHVEAEVLEESIDPEPIVGGKADIGELATQYLSLALDPYPHAEGVAYEFSAGPATKDAEGANLRKSPFEALKDWKEKR